MPAVSAPLVPVRVVEQRGRLRLRAVTNGLFVQCPREWRERLAVGAVHQLPARLRSDGACYVYTPGMTY